MDEQLTSDMTLAEVARLVPQAMGVFEAAGIDYCCKGARPLADAAEDAGIAAEHLLLRIKTAPRDPSARNWNHEPLHALVRCLVGEHRQLIGHTLPSLQRLLSAAAISGDARITRIARLFADFSERATEHMLIEERDLFPVVEQLEASSYSGTHPALRIGHRVLGELVEHEGFHERLRTIRELVSEMGEGCVLAANFRDLAADIHRHIHLENNVLYPRAMALENELRRDRPPAE